jgi:hypothetical protein
VGSDQNAEVLTPHVAAMAKEGVILDRHYVYKVALKVDAVSKNTAGIASIYLISTTH